MKMITAVFFLDKAYLWREDFQQEESIKNADLLYHV
jgi:hypothetical protein